VEPDEEARQPAVLGLGQPGRPGEVLEPEAGQEHVHLSTAPPVVDDPHDRRIIGLGRAPEADASGAVHQPWTGPELAPHHDGGEDDLARHERAERGEQVLQQLERAALPAGNCPGRDIGHDEGADRQADGEPHDGSTGDGSGVVARHGRARQDEPDTGASRARGEQQANRRGEDRAERDQRHSAQSGNDERPREGAQEG